MTGQILRGRLGLDRHRKGAPMRIASFNVENLFERAAAMDPVDWEKGKPILERQAQLNAILGQDVYTAADQDEILRLLGELNLLPPKDGRPYVVLRENHGRLVTRHRDGRLEVLPNGRADWLGWVELRIEAVDAVSTRHTAQVVRDVAADVQAFVEIEGRPALKDFSDDLLPLVGGMPFAHVMSIEGNDARGIDVGLALKDGWAIESMVSHVDDANGHGTIFSRDCPVYRLAGPAGAHVVVLVNHLKSQGFGSQAENDARRREQAERVAQIYQDLRAAGEQHIVVLGDFNAAPQQDHGSLSPLLAGTDLKDISEAAAFDDGGFPGTFKNCTARDKIDYILLSPDLFGHVQGGGIFRKGAWGGEHGTKWEHYPDMTSAAEAASDHAAIWADLDL